MYTKWYQFVHIISFQNHHVGGLGLRLVYSVIAQDHRCLATDLIVTRLFIFCLIEKSKSLLFHKSCLCSLQCSFHCELKCQILPHLMWQKCCLEHQTFAPYSSDCLFRDTGKREILEQWNNGIKIPRMHMCTLCYPCPLPRSALYSEVRHDVLRYRFLLVRIP